MILFPLVQAAVAYGQRDKAGLAIDELVIENKVQVLQRTVNQRTVGGALWSQAALSMPALPPARRPACPPVPAAQPIPLLPLAARDRDALQAPHTRHHVHLLVGAPLLCMICISAGHARRTQCHAVFVGAGPALAPHLSAGDSTPPPSVLVQGGPGRRSLPRRPHRLVNTLLRLGCATHAVLRMLPLRHTSDSLSCPASHPPTRPCKAGWRSTWAPTGSSA